MSATGADAAAASARNVVGHKRYGAMPELTEQEDSNSNGGAYAAGSDGDRVSGSNPANTPTPRPGVSTPGIGTAPIVNRYCPVVGSQIERNC